MTDIERFMRHVFLDPSGCHVWTGTRNAKKNGRLPYGRFRVGGKMVLAHRFSYEIHCSHIPTDMLVLHKCDNPTCVNPEHFFLGSHKDNAVDREQKGRNRATKLSNAQVLEIRRIKSSENLSNPRIAAMFGCSASQVQRIVTGRLRGLVVHSLLDGQGKESTPAQTLTIGLVEGSRV